MSEQDLAALEAADEGIAETPVEATETPENPAPEQSEEEKTKSQVRRERRKAQADHVKEEAARAVERATQAETRLARIKNAAQGIQEPQEVEFADPIEYAAAKGAWHSSRMAARMQQGEVEAELSEHRSAVAAIEEDRKRIRQAEISEDLPEARARYADFDKALETARNADVIAPFLADMVLEAEQPLDLIYSLGSNPELARRISRMNPVAAARELGRLEASLSAPKPKYQSSAPAPISPVKGGGTVGKAPESMSYKEFKVYRDAGGKL